MLKKLYYKLHLKFFTWWIDEDGWADAAFAGIILVMFLIGYFIGVA